MGKSNFRKKKTAGIIGASGYTGHELVKILSKHPKVELKVLNSRSFAGKKVSELYSDFKGGLSYTGYSVESVDKMGLDLVFIALPHGHAMEMERKLNKKIRIVDLGADFRFQDMNLYEKIYHVKPAIENNTAIYGLPELFRTKIKKARVVANPGCYVTASILSTYPIQKYAKYIVFDCKSGWSGAGKESAYAKNPSIARENLIPYNTVKHRHKYEIQQFIKTPLSFSPLVFDAFRGMMCTAHVLLKRKIKKEQITEIYKRFYRNEPFVRIRDGLPEVRDTQNTNYCDIGGFEIDENNQVIIISTIDNLLKGAAGQAVQNMNLMLGFDEKEGL